jgi:type VI secretion system protein ImpA
MKSQLDMEAILGPIPGDNPAGEDLRYDPTYDLIKEARKSDDNLDQGAWKTEIKSADWEKVHISAVLECVSPEDAFDEAEGQDR